jgi:transcription elongation GreA/GreB family factor
MIAEIQKTVDSGKLTPSAGAALEKLSAGAFVMHKSWGFGQIDSLNFLVNQVTINFKAKKGHTMQLQYAAESLTVIPKEHILAQKAADPSSVKARAKSDPAGLVRTILTSLGGKATHDQIASTLVPDVMSDPEFKKWLESAKKALKNEGHFAIPTKKGLPFELREGPVSHADEYISALNNARQIKHQVTALDLIVKNLAEFKEPVAQLQPVITATNDTARKSARLHTAEALSLLLTRDELIEKVPGLEKGADAPTVAGVLLDGERQLASLLAEVPAAKMKRVLSEVPAAFGDAWIMKAVTLVLNGNTRVVTDAARLLQEKGANAELRNALERAISEHSITSDALNWLCKERDGELATLINVRVLHAIIAALERDQFSEKRDRKLHDLLLNDKELLTDLIATASPEELREAMRKLLLTPVFDELNKRSLLGRIIRAYPELQSMVTGDSTEEQEALVVSWESLEKRKAEYEELVTKKIPENTKEISIARSYGDLRENFEFKAAKEMQRVLMRRQAETQRDLARARGTDFANVDIKQVSIGTVVTLQESATGQTSVYSILGAWDSDPDKSVVSYLAAVAQALLGHKVAEEVEVPTEHGERRVKIAKIEAYKKA